ncbi:hypothetical protein M8C21_000477 [Ambrosia artemisiifolia]|uniref:Protein TIC 40, chloroplastic n=1 Tax=Ambrosia artemisiifolia TaxID=4212 RepID=A0AAD5DCZ0_AMBAR|nr:hypothetical protein M8C21_000477 [Ambrosia artemisiifolia]
MDASKPRIPSTTARYVVDQIGLTPEEVISKIMANPEVAMIFQNPRVQAAIMDCSQNTMSIIKYQNDKENGSFVWKQRVESWSADVREDLSNCIDTVADVVLLDRQDKWS